MPVLPLRGVSEDPPDAPLGGAGEARAGSGKINRSRFAARCARLFGHALRKLLDAPALVFPLSVPASPTPPSGGTTRRVSRTPLYRPPVTGCQARSGRGPPRAGAAAAPRNP